MVAVLLRGPRLGVARHHHHINIIRSRGQEYSCVVIFVQATHPIRNKLAFFISVITKNTTLRCIIYLFLHNFLKRHIHILLVVKILKRKSKQGTCVLQYQDNIKYKIQLYVALYTYSFIGSKIALFA